MIALVDYGMGNLRSVEKALQRVGGEVRIVKTAAELSRADRLVLPGVGAFGVCIQNLAQQQLLEPLKQWIQSGKPFLGICLGYQALFESSEEQDGVTGLDVFKGHVVRFPENELKVPQMGWNRIQIRKNNCPLLRNIPEGTFFYFVHSYFPRPSDSGLICTETDYGSPFASMIWKENVFACQFHPEKSQAMGLQMLKNFVEL